MKTEDGKDKTEEISDITVFDGSIVSPKGFLCSAAQAGIKYENRDDVALLYCEVPCHAAGVFTNNKVKAAPVLWDSQIIQGKKDVRAVLVNTGIANAATGKPGMDVCEEEAKAVATELGIKSSEVLIGSTGVIGQQIPVDKIKNSVKGLKNGLSKNVDMGHRAARAIMTTDTVSKEFSVRAVIGGREVIVSGMAKGSGMIHPDMCTLLGYITTDCAIDAALMQTALKDAVSDSFNMISVDGDTSTNDTILLLGSGLAGNAVITEQGDDYKTFYEMLCIVTVELAKKAAADGEGATKLIESAVTNAKTQTDARILAKAVITSSLVKAAFFGNDANWGRIICAMGYAGGDFDPNLVRISFTSDKGEIVVCENGQDAAFDEDLAGNILKSEHVVVHIDLQDGTFAATAWGCDLSYDYVKINADYRS